MLSRADAQLTARDRDLPLLPVLLDPDALADLLRAALPEVDLRQARATYLRYKPRTSCLAACALDVGGRTVDAYVTAYAAGGRPKLDKVRQRPAVDGPLGPGRLVLEDHGLVVSFFPNDLSLRGLMPLADPAQRAALLRQMLPNHAELWGASLASLRYKPERRYVGRVGAGEASAVVRAYTYSRYPAGRTTIHALRHASLLRLPRRLGVSTRHRLVAVEWLAGRVLADAFGNPALGAMGRALGRALAVLHTQEGEGLPARDLRESAEHLRAVAEHLSFLAPGLSTRIDALSRRVGAALTDAPPAITALHGDLHAGQVVIMEKGIGLLDLDNAVRGDPALDVAHFLAHLEWDVLRGRLSRAEMEELSHAVLDGYGGAHPLGPRLAVESAAELIALAPHPFRERRPEWDAELEAIINRVEEVVQGRSWAGAPFVGPPSPLAGTARVPVDDPTGAAYDEALPFLARALDPQRVPAVLCDHLAGSSADLTLAAIRVLRHKRGRRCLVEYELEVGENGIAGIPAGRVTLMGKVHAKGLNAQAVDLHRALWERGFEADSADGISVPYSAGVLPEFRMWLQVKAPGLPAGSLLAGPGGPALASRIGAALAKLHGAGVPASRRHSVQDELRILDDGLARVARTYPRWAERVDRIAKGCRQLALSLPAVAPRGIHRDFYADHVLVDGARLWLIDFDLYAEGDPAVDVGNFLAHLVEQGLRTMGDPEALHEVARALEDSYLAQGGGDPAAIRAYTTLSLARHIFLSTQFPDRRPFTGMLMDLCEQRLTLPLPTTQPAPSSPMRIVVIGAGYVGLTVAAGLAHLGHHVRCVEKDPARLAAIQAGTLPFQEPGLQNLVAEGMRSERLSLTGKLDGNAADAAVALIAVGTPPRDDGEADLSDIEAAVGALRRFGAAQRVVAIKSTVPVGTTDGIGAMLSDDVAFNPEFLREGAAVSDFLHPTRVVIGTRSRRAAHVMADLYRPLGGPLVMTDPPTAEMIKYAANAFLAGKVSFINEVAEVCAHVGADVATVARGIGLDPRIGPHFLRAGAGFGGSCLPKDIKALSALARRYDLEPLIIDAVLEVNERSRRRIMTQLEAALGGLERKTVAVLGLAFKAGTSDVRDSAGVDIASRLIAAGAAVRALDPAVAAEALPALPSVQICRDPLAAVEGAHAVAILTDWPEFERIDWQRARERMCGSLVLDGRGLRIREMVEAAGLLYVGPGQPLPLISYLKPSRDLLTDGVGTVVRSPRRA